MLLTILAGRPPRASPVLADTPIKIGIAERMRVSVTRDEYCHLYQEILVICEKNSALSIAVAV